MLLLNEFIGYVTRSYEQIKTDLLQKFRVKIPEMTDHTEQNIFVRLLGVWGAILENLGFYVDNAARECYLSTCRLYKSAVKLAKLVDYRIRGYSASSVDLKFTTNVVVPSDLLIPAGTIVETDDGLAFITTTNATITAGTDTVTAPAQQRIQILAAAVGTSNGTPTQRYVIDDFVVDGLLVVRVGPDTYLFKETLAYSRSTDLHFTSNVNEDGKIYIEFGDGFSGKIPPNGQPIEIDYFYTEGAAGNVPERIITNIISTITLPGGVASISVINPSRSSGGADRESLFDLKNRIPKSIRTQFRAVSIQDHVDIALLYPGVAKAAVPPKEELCGKTVDLYIAPDGGGFPSNTLLNNVKAYFDDKKMVATPLNVKGAGESRVVIKADVRIKPNYSNTGQLPVLKQRLLDFFSVEQQDITGRLEVGNVYEVLERSESVIVSQITTLYVKPFGTPLFETAVALDWDRELLPASNSTVHWTLKMITTNSFQLFRENNYAGTYNTGDNVIKTELQFTVIGSYTAGDQWEFVTYNYNAVLTPTQLEELSILVAFEEDITLNISGGI